MEREKAYPRKLGTVVESIEAMPHTTEDLSNLEREGVLHLVQVAIDAVMDTTAMLTKDQGHRVRDDYHNFEALQENDIIDEALASRLATLNGLRNAIVHKYNKFEEQEVFDNLDRITKDLTEFATTIDDFQGATMSQQPTKPSLQAIKEDLNALRQHEVVLHGSYLHETFTPRSDIDIAVITRSQTKEENRTAWRELLGQAPAKYDIRVFELFPLDIQHEIANKHEVLFGDPIEISYYLYRIHRLWKDVGPRIEANQFESLRERMRLMGES